MENKIALIGIIVKDIDNIPKLNSLLSEYGGDTIVARMGIPYRKRKINIITILVDAKEEIINVLFEKIKEIDGVYPKLNLIF